MESSSKKQPKEKVSNTAPDTNRYLTFGVVSVLIAFYTVAEVTSANDLVIAVVKSLPALFLSATV